MLVQFGICKSITAQVTSNNRTIFSFEEMTKWREKKLAARLQCSSWTTWRVIMSMDHKLPYGTDFRKYVSLLMRNFKKKFFIQILALEHPSHTNL